MTDKDLTIWAMIPEPIRAVLVPLRLGLWLVGGGAIACTGPDRCLPPRDWDFLMDARVSTEAVISALMWCKPRIKWKSTIFGGFKGEIDEHAIDIFRYDDVAHYLSTVPYPRHGIAINLGTGFELTTAEFQKWRETDISNPIHECVCDEVITTRPVRNPNYDSGLPGDPLDNEPSYRH